MDTISPIFDRIRYQTFTIDWTSTAPMRAVVKRDGRLVGSRGIASCPRDVSETLLSHFLDQTNVLLPRDTILDCNTKRHTFLMPPQGTSNILLLDGGAQQYTIASAGLPFHNLTYKLLRGSSVIKSGSLSEMRFSDSLSVAAGAAPVVLEVRNINNYPVELLIERATVPGQPYRFTAVRLQDTVEVCTGTDTFTYTASITNPRFPTSLISNCAGLAQMRNAQLVDAAGAVVAGLNVTANVQQFNATIQVDLTTGNVLAPGNYTLLGSAVLPAGCAAATCIDTSAVAIAVAVVVTPAADTIQLSDVTLDANGQAMIFTDSSFLTPRSVSAAGQYTQLHNCTLYQQNVVSNAVTIDLGPQFICPGTCLLAPTGQTLSCVEGPASLLASNDTTYLATILFDSTQSLQLTSAVYRL